MAARAIQDAIRALDENEESANEAAAVADRVPAHFIGVEQAAHRFGYSPRQMQRYAAKGVEDGAAVMVGKTYFVDPDRIAVPVR